MTPEERTALLERYRRTREESRPLVNELMRRCGRLAEPCARELGMWHDRAIVADNETEMTLLMDYVVFYPTKGHANAAARWLAEGAVDLGPREREVLGALAAAHYSLFEVLSVDPGLGIGLRDYVGGEEHLMVDENFSRTLQVGKTIGTRLLTIDGITRSTGAGLPAVPRIVEELRGRLVPRIAQRLAEPGFRLGPHEQASLARRVIELCIKAGITRRVIYQ